MTQVRSFATDIGHMAASFLNNQNPASVVPDFFLIPFSSRQTEVQIRITSSHRQILALAVHANWFQMNTKLRCNQP